MALVPSKSHSETTVLKRTKYGGWEGGKNDIEKKRNDKQELGYDPKAVTWQWKERIVMRQSSKDRGLR